MRLRIYLLATSLLCLAIPACAAAAPFGPAEEIAFQEAAAYWGQAPTLCTSIAKEIVPSGSLGVDEEGRDVKGRATQPTGLPVACGVWVEEEALGPHLCTYMRHEYGHLLGYGHEDTELSQMPACEITVPYVATRKEERREAWKNWRWARTECVAARGPYRAKCWKWLRREAKKIRTRYVPIT